MITPSGHGPGVSPSRRLLGWFLFYRILVITLFLGGAIAYQLRSGLNTPRPVLPFLYLLVGLSYLQAVLSALLLPRTRQLRFHAQVQISWDLLLATALIYFSGGIESLFSFLYLLIIVSSSAILPRKDVIFVASASSILYGSLLDLQYYRYLPLIGGMQFSSYASGRDVFYAVFVNVLAFFLTALLSGTLSERLRRSEQALEKKEIDYEELENLNRAILGNISSGLMIVNQQGRIRSFNEAAEKISGLSLREVYDRDILTIFPSLALVDNEGLHTVQRGQTGFCSSSGENLTLGFTSTLVRDGRGEILGLLVVFQDLTSLLEMEAKLKRVDRLAAVGRLAAGMAHEIRNPLASISGSVQLIMEGHDVKEEDLRLMGIVVREANRLSELLTDFLVYARPAQPHPVELQIGPLFDELFEMIKQDGRFSGLTLGRDCPNGLRLFADRQQIRQVLWDLMINAAEAMEGEGSLRVGMTPADSALFVEDSGPGINPEVRDRIFEPFFTTKLSGTGLGLATVHSLVVANGGNIEVGPGSEGGTRFTIRLPLATGNIL